MGLGQRLGMSRYEMKSEAEQKIKTVVEVATRVRENTEVADGQTVDDVARLISRPWIRLSAEPSL